ncbi:response regulator [Pelagicoccus sp. SDUM812002]|uniref:response regulator n=1 Tax=Pelagicoccus sp. SDUM812002 TaxID=3041266 RepID=UPI00280DE8BD|nr:response regulator [Pelagicoccus sp. SDUM812002]MDQ8186481.1 response regulator [Pelagicoccus sp. SDUM812002]
MNDTVKILALVSGRERDNTQSEDAWWEGLDGFELTVVDLDADFESEIKAIKPDLLLLECLLNSGNGVARLEALRSSFPHLPVFLISDPFGNSWEENISKFHSLLSRGKKSRSLVRAKTVDQTQVDTPPLARSRRRILVIDDDPEDRELVRRSLERTMSDRYEVFEAKDGEEGLRMVEALEPDCALLDYSFPGKDGLSILSEIRAERPELPIILLTGLGSESVAVKALQLGAQDYILKSTINKSILHQIIVNACQRQEMQRKMKEQQESLTVFTRALAHDLKEPIRSIRSFSQLAMEEGADPSDQKQYIRIVDSAAGHMEKLVDMVHNYTQLDDEPEELSPKSHSTEKLVEQALENLSRQIREAPNRIAYENLHPVFANETLVVSLFQNLISNALNFAHESLAEVRISSVEEKGWVEFSVADNGPGIEESMRNKVFRPFVRLENGRRRGTGLGLSICRKIVQRNGGKIWIEPNHRQGTVIKFTLPLGIQELETKTGEKAPAGGVGGEGMRIANVLQVDDNPNDLFLTKMSLKNLDHLELNIYTVENGKEALRFLKDESNEPIDLILLDINMPIMDGFEFLKKMNEEGDLRRIPTIVCSTSNDDRDIRSAKKLGALGYIIKPIRLAKLESTIAPIDTVKITKTVDNYRLESSG